jgi:hypothetical protein
MGTGGSENLSGAISWLTLFLAETGMHTLNGCDRTKPFADGVDDQIEHHWLHLDAIALDEGQVLREQCPHRDVITVGKAQSYRLG